MGHSQIPIELGTTMLYQTARLYARRIGLSDLESMYAVYGNAVAMRWVGDGNGRDSPAKPCVG